MAEPSSCSRRGRHHGYPRHEVFAAGPAAELVRSPSEDDRQRLASRAEMLRDRQLTSVIAYYGIDQRPAALGRFYHAVVAWCAKIGHPPTKLAIEAPDYSGKPRAFERENQKLLRYKFKGVEALELAAMTPDGDWILRDWTVHVSWSTCKHYAIICGVSEAMPFGSETMTGAARLAAESLNPKYGIGYQMKGAVPASFTAFGVAVSPAGTGPSERLDRIGAWGVFGMPKKVWEAGILRDVYPWNFLGAALLKRRIAGTTLRKWVEQDPRRGRLEPFTDETMLWKVDKTAIREVRTRLREAGLLFVFDWKRWR